MTRLRPELLEPIPSSLASLDRNLSRSTGEDLLGLAARTTDIPRGQAVAKIEASSAAVVPISSGEGVIPGFVAAVTAVLQHIGLRAWIAGQRDVGGIAEAFERGAGTLFAADDERFLAIHLRTASVTDNAWATGAGFAQALAAAAEMRSGGMADQEVLVLGLGRVGTHAVFALQGMGCRVSVFDVDRTRSETFSRTCGGVRVAGDLRAAFRTIDYVLDATPAAEIIDDAMIRPRTVVSCPGVPHGLTRSARAKLGNGFIHDSLALGVAVMALQSLRGDSPARCCSPP